MEAHTKVEEKQQIYLPYNILPLDPDSKNQEIMKYPEVSTISISKDLKSMNYVFRLQVKCIASFIALQIRVTVSALRNTRGLPWPKDYKKKVDEDILDWLQAMFGFQVRLLPNRLSYTS